MANFSGPKCRYCRRVGNKLFLKGSKCFSSKCAIETRTPGNPGAHGSKRSRLTDFGVALREKMKLKQMYGVLEKQFRKHYSEAERRKGATGENLLKLLETRLDNVVYRMGFSSSRQEARQLVSHKGIVVNGRMVNIPSYEIKEGDVVSVRENGKSQSRITEALNQQSDLGFSDWLKVDVKAFEGKYLRAPERTDLPSDIKENLVVELYSK